MGYRVWAEKIHILLAVRFVRAEHDARERERQDKTDQTTDRQIYAHIY